MTTITIQASNNQTVDQIAKVAPSLPPDVWGVIANLSSSTMREDMQLMGVCKAARQGIKGKWIEWLNKIPNARQLAKKFELGQISSQELLFREVLPELFSMAERAEKQKMISICRTAGKDQEKALFNYFKKDMEMDKCLLEMISERSIQEFAKHVARSDYSSWFLSSILFLDKNVDKVFDLSLIDEEKMGQAGCYCLMRGRIRLFKKILTAILTEGSARAIDNFLVVSGQMNQIDIFKKLLNSKRLFSASWVLSELASADSSSEAISLLLASNTPIPIYERYHTHHDLSGGLQEAMRNAVEGNQMEALQAILNGRQGQRIDYRIFRDIINEFADNPERELIVQLLTDAVENRYPEGDPFPPENPNPPQQQAPFHNADNFDARIERLEQRWRTTTKQTKILLPLALLTGFLAGIIFQYYANFLL